MIDVVVHIVEPLRLGYKAVPAERLQLSCWTP